LNLPIPAARAIGAASESAARALGAKKAPLMTRMGMGIMSCNMYFDNSKARRVLDYTPEYSFPGALQQYASWVRAEGII
jgi:nucleoside-diphosphate-sugar epimerase